jgi:hypothetical protein
MKTVKSRQAPENADNEPDHEAVGSSLYKVCNQVIPFSLSVMIRLKAH